MKRFIDLVKEHEKRCTLAQRVHLFVLLRADGSEAVSRAGEGQHVTDVLDTGEVHQQTLEAQAVASVLHAAKLCADSRYQS